MAAGCSALRPLAYTRVMEARSPPCAATCYIPRRDVQARASTPTFAKSADTVAVEMVLQKLEHCEVKFVAAHSLVAP